ncbi:hypothetical protein V9T40_010667 [Parthenolecanium corni]|uniref:Uncharacterized protein n=1 Tax=Parthenolecanium corni TaxID=536013 RepID=A0AAN9XXE4_9HEMI
MLIRRKDVQVPPDAKTVPLGQKRKRGRPSKATRALLRFCEQIRSTSEKAKRGWDEGAVAIAYREERGGYKNHRLHPVCYSPQSSTGDRPERPRLKI